MPLINQEKVATVNLASGEYWVRLTLRLSQEFTGGDLVQFPPGAPVSVEGVDELSSCYDTANWVSGIASGALYAFRTLRIPRQRLSVLKFAGRLHACDMDALAIGAALAIARRAEQELTHASLDDWTGHVQVTDKRQPIPTPTHSPEAIDL